jgi:hypothetical protein
VVVVVVVAVVVAVLVSFSVVLRQSVLNFTCHKRYGFQPSHCIIRVPREPLEQNHAIVPGMRSSVPIPHRYWGISLGDDCATIRTVRRRETPAKMSIL